MNGLKDARKKLIEIDYQIVKSKRGAGLDLLRKRRDLIVKYIWTYE